MSPFAAIVAKSAGVVSAASPSPSPTATPDRHAARHAVVKAVVDSEADVLGVKPEELRKDLKEGKKVSDLAKARGMTKEQFAAKLVVALKPRLEALVDHRLITQAQADKILDRIARGYVPFWDGIHHRQK
jgi:hypothetical protein